MKKIVKINESQIKSIVRESLKRALKENAEEEGIRDWFSKGNAQQTNQQVPQQQPQQAQQPNQQAQVYLVVDITMTNNSPKRLINYGLVSQNTAQYCRQECHADREAYAHIFDNEQEYNMFLNKMKNEGYDIKGAKVTNGKAVYWQDKDNLFGNGQISESQLNRIINKTVKKVLKENAEDEGRFLNWLGIGNRRNAQQPVQPQQQMQGQEGEGGTCPKCGSQTKPGARFCNKCGENLTGESSFCKFCGKPKKPEQKFCSHCGKYIGPLKESKKKIRLNEARFDIGGYSCLVNGGNYVYFDKMYNSGELKRYYYDIRSNKWPEGTPDLRNVSSEELTSELEKAGLNGMVASRIANRVGARPTQTQSPAQNGAPMQRQSSQGGWTRREYDQVNKNDYEINPQAAWQAYNGGKITWNEFDRICKRMGVDPSKFTYNSI